MHTREDLDPTLLGNSQFGVNSDCPNWDLHNKRRLDTEDINSADITSPLQDDTELDNNNNSSYTGTTYLAVPYNDYFSSGVSTPSSSNSLKSLIRSPRVSNFQLYCQEIEDEHDSFLYEGKRVHKKLMENVESNGVNRYLGLLLTLAASLCYSLVVLFVKILSQDYSFDAYGLSFWRYIGTLIPSIPLFLLFECGSRSTQKQNSILAGVWPLWEKDNWKTWIGLLSRGLIGSTSVILRYYALQNLSIGDTSVITYSTPILVTVMAHFFLGERCGVFSICVAIITLCGVVIVTKPPLLTGMDHFDTNTMIGTGFACGSLLCSATIVIITRKIREVHFTVMTLAFGSIGVMQALVLTYYLGNFNLPTGLWDTFLVTGVSALSFIGQMAIVLALKKEQAGPVALIRSCDVVFGFLLQYIFLQVEPDLYSAIGAVIVLTAVLSTGFRKWLTTLPKTDSRRSTWWIILK